MSIDPAVRAALRRFERRAVVVSFTTSVSIALIAVTLMAEIVWLSGAWNTIAMLALAVIAVAASAIYALAGRPSPAILARQIDARAGLNDLVVTSLQCGGDGMPALVRRAGLASLARESPSRAYPFRAPRQWRWWLLAATAVQLVAVPMLLRAPAERTAAPGLSALSLPPASGAAGANAASGRETAAANPTTLGGTPNTTTRTAAEAKLTGTPLASDALNTAARDAAAAGVSGNDDRLKLAAANADAEIAAGRVPLARRAMVQRYFAALQSQKRRPR